MAWFQSRQQKLAVEMWEEVKRRIASETLYDIKLEFTYRHNLHWVNRCWLCENACRVCSNCKLKDCKNFNTTFGRVCSEELSLEARLHACDKIIKAIKDTDRYYVLEDNRLTTVPGDREFKFTGTLKACLAFVDCIKGLEEDEVE